MKSPIIARHQAHVFTQSRASRKAVGRLMPWLVAEANRLAAGDEVMAERLFAHARQHIEELDVGRFEDDDEYLRAVLAAAMRQKRLAG
jgi:hypothetical protein